MEDEITEITRACTLPAQMAASGSMRTRLSGMDVGTTVTLERLQEALQPNFAALRDDLMKDYELRLSDLESRIIINFKAAMSQSIEKKISPEQSSSTAARDQVQNAALKADLMRDYELRLRDLESRIVVHFKMATSQNVQRCHSKDKAQTRVKRERFGSRNSTTLSHPDSDCSKEEILYSLDNQDSGGSYDKWTTLRNMQKASMYDRREVSPEADNRNDTNLEGRERSESPNDSPKAAVKDASKASFNPLNCERVDTLHSGGGERGVTLPDVSGWGRNKKSWRASRCSNRSNTMPTGDVTNFSNFSNVFVSNPEQLASSSTTLARLGDNVNDVVSSRTSVLSDAASSEPLYYMPQAVQAMISMVNKPLSIASTPFQRSRSGSLKSTSTRNHSQLNRSRSGSLKSTSRLQRSRSGSLKSKDAFDTQRSRKSTKCDDVPLQTCLSLNTVHSESVMNPNCDSEEGEQGHELWGKALDSIRKSTDFVFATCSIWQESKSMNHLKKSKSERASSISSDAALYALYQFDDDSDCNSNVYETSQKCCNRTFSRLVVHPTCWYRVAWDLIGAILVAYDLMILPLSLLELPPSTFQSSMTWTIRIYWSCDFPSLFFTGYQNNLGDIVLQPAAISKHYVKGWMLFDASLVLLDWFELVAANGSGLSAARIAKMFKAMKMLRMFRIVRLLRVVTLPNFIRDILYGVHSESLSIVCGLVKIMFFVACLVHIVGCCWFGIGNVGATDGWVVKYGLKDASVNIRYVTSVHWALSQFIGTMEIYPQNGNERTFSVIALFLAFFISASVVSSITSSMTQLQIVAAKQTTMVSDLHEYLHDHSIPRRTAVRVQRNAMHALQEQKKNTPEDRVELLKYVSEPLRIELHYEMYLPTMCTHPFFSRYHFANTVAFERICHYALEQALMPHGDMLFGDGEVPSSPRMFILTKGKLTYLREMQDPTQVPSGSWISEGTLWTVWVHLGTMRAKIDCTVVAVNAHSFQTVALRFATQANWPQKYAEAFVAALNAMDKDDISDIDEGVIDIEEIAEAVFKSIGRGKTRSGVNMEE